jgi:hypothetical protein
MVCARDERARQGGGRTRTSARALPAQLGLFVDAYAAWQTGGEGEAAPSGGDRHCWGVALIGVYRVTDAFGIGARGEHVRDDANYSTNDAGGDVSLIVPFVRQRWRSSSATAKNGANALARAAFGGVHGGAGTTPGEWTLSS